jgi:hypothetical protein
MMIGVVVVIGDAMAGGVGCAAVEVAVTIGLIAAAPRLETMPR